MAAVKAAAALCRRLHAFGQRHVQPPTVLLLLPQSDLLSFNYWPIIAATLNTILQLPVQTSYPLGETRTLADVCGYVLPSVSQAL
ncbi:hypothetical protein RvY_12621 [Ramazzottius varieornatus]|uniref:Uncharacterized protein n=1 Tax=Ramazzottius varieornatus TaxID=947166 RepID=A0A1D1VPB8_RAMVA|nr:hypothetical protein RvY_12621 [Ramazzottius varieornatus]